MLRIFLVFQQFYDVVAGDAAIDALEEVDVVAKPILKIPDFILIPSQSFPGILDTMTRIYVLVSLKCSFNFGKYISTAGRYLAYIVLQLVVEHCVGQGEIFIMYHDREVANSSYLA
jgi:hypothetical protein